MRVTSKKRHQNNEMKWNEKEYTTIDTVEN